MGSLTNQVSSRRARASRRRGDFSKAKPPTTKDDVGVFENGYYIVPKDVSLGTTVEFFANAAPKSTTVARANFVDTHEKKGSVVSARACSPSTTTTKVRRSNTLPAPHVQKNQGSYANHSKSPPRRQNETVELLSPNFFENFEPLPENSTGVNKHHLNKIYSEPHLPKIAVQSPTKPMVTGPCAIKSPQEQKTPTKSKTPTSTHWAGGAYMNSPAPKLLPMPDFDDDNDNDDDENDSDGTNSDTSASKSLSNILIVHKSASEPSTPSISRAPSPSSPEGPVLQHGAPTFPLGYIHPIMPVPFHLPPTQYAYFPPPHSYPMSPLPSSQHLSCGSYARYGGY